MNINRPDLTNLDPQIRAYIEMLEQELERCHQSRPTQDRKRPPETDFEDDAVFDVNEPPTTINLISATASGIAKRTPRHLYARQRRGGMGIFDIETEEDDPPTILSALDHSQTALLITTYGRSFRMPVSAIPEAPVRGRGESIVNKLDLAEDEKLCAITSIQSQGYLALVSQRGYVRLLRHHVFGEYMKPGMSLFDPRRHGQLAAVAWTPGEGELFLATRTGKAIRFAEKLVPPGGVQGVRLEAGDVCVGIAAIDEDSNVFLLGADGKGTIRQMGNFNPNKAPGAGGKIAMNTDQLIAAQTIEKDTDIFIISRLSKIIRFDASEVPPKDGVVQGVICMTLRADHPAALVTSSK